MEELFRRFVEAVALAVEAGAGVFILIGAIEAVYHLLTRLGARGNILRKKQIWVRFATWLLLALEFELAAYVLRTAISPTWDDIAKLAVIATIRTMLNYFLAKDIASFERGTE